MIACCHERANAIFHAEQGVDTFQDKVSWKISPVNNCALSLIILVRYLVLPCELTSCQRWLHITDNLNIKGKLLCTCKCYNIHKTETPTHFFSITWLFIVIDKLNHNKLRFCDSLLVNFINTFFWKTFFIFLQRFFSFEKIKEENIFFRNTELWI